MSYYIANGTFYTVPEQSNELYHYGVPGMKWGHRKASYYDAKSKSHAAKIGISKTRLGKSYHNYRAFRNEVKSGEQKMADSFSKNGVLRNLDNLYGHGANTRNQTAASNYYDRKSTYTKTRLGTSIAKSNAYNLKTAAEANTRLSNSKSIKEYGKNYLDAMANRSIKTWSGRTTTTGKQMVDSLLTGGTMGSIQDINYYNSGRRKAKETYKKSTDKAFKEYESSIADIEKNYKRGQRLSKEDQAREEAVEKKYADEVAKAKADYKKARRG